MKKRLFTVLLALVMVLSLMPGVFAEDDILMYPTYNRDLQTYDNYTYPFWAQPVWSYLVPDGNGWYYRVEYLPDGDDVHHILVEHYGSSGIDSQKFVACELTSFGGFFAGADNYYAVYGADNQGESDTAEVLRVVKYSKAFKRLGSVSIKGNNTTVPFDAGSLRMVEDGTYLYVHTCHEMYAIDGVNHQANLTFVVRKSDMTVTDIRSNIMNKDYGYVSHSFNQFIALDSGRAVMLDHGDASPRSAYLYRCQAIDSSGKCLPSFANGRVGEGVNVMTFTGGKGENETCASLGGLVVTATHYLVIGASIDHSVEDAMYNDSQREIFVAAVPKDNFTDDAVQLRWVTNYKSGDLEYISTPQAVSLSDGRAIVLWTKQSEEDSRIVHYRFLKADGSFDGAEKTMKGALSDCAPVQIGSKVVWYVTESDDPNFYSINVTAAPKITTQPKSVTVSAGSTAKFTVAASGTGLSYQWQFKAPGTSTWNNSSMTGAKTATLSVEATTARSGQQYRCVVKNAGGSVTSNAATLTVTSAPKITTQPKSVTVKEGATAKFTVAASGTGLSYQWQYKAPGTSEWHDSGMTGAKTATLSVSATAARNGQQYRCVVKNSYGSVTSSAAKLTVLSQPKITTQPKSVTAGIGQAVKFTVAATGGNLSYQWQYKAPGTSTWYDSGMTGAKTATLTVEATTGRNGQQYRCVIKNSVGTVTSTAAKLTVTNKPVITTQPASKTATAGSTVKFTVAAAGQNLSYQWQFKAPGTSTWYDSGMTGAKTATLTVAATAARNGQQYRCIVTNPNGSATSNAAKLTVK